MSDDEQQTFTEWRVTWFPPDARQRSQRGAMPVVDKIAREQAEWHPIVERREITVGPWRIGDTSDPR